MIKANELRIWNVIKFDDGSEDVVKIRGLWANDEMWFVEWFKIAGNGSFDCGNSILDDFEPIPLTPEVLEKCGFENDNGEFTHPDNTDFDLMFSCSDNGLWCGYNFGGEFHGPFNEKKPQGVSASPICNPFKYLHQLQNLYFALTGEELTYNP